MIQLLSEVKEQKLPLVFLDEAVFTFNTFNAKAWSAPYASIKVMDYKMRVKTQALISAVSLDEGMVDYSIHHRSIKTEEFKAFMDKLSLKFDRQPFAVFLDNLSVHKCNLSKEMFKELDVTAIFNIPYSP